MAPGPEPASILDLIPELTNDWAKQPSARRQYPESVERWRADVAKLMPEALKQRPDAERLVDKMLHVVSWESGGDPGAIGDGGVANGLFQSHYVGRGASPEQQIADAWRLVLPNPNQWTDWGEGVTYQGKPFGALGNYPYDSSPAGGGARMSGGGGGGGGGGSYTGQAPDTGSVAARVVAKRLDAETARQGQQDEERRATLETQLGAPLAALPHEEEARTSHGPDPVYAHDVAAQARLDTGHGYSSSADVLGGAFEPYAGKDTGMLYGPEAPSITDPTAGGQQYTEEGAPYVQHRGTLLGEVEARRKGESRYGAITEAIKEDPVGVTEVIGMGLAPLLLGPGSGLTGAASFLPHGVGLAEGVGALGGQALLQPYVSSALQSIPGYEKLPGSVQAVAEQLPQALFGPARLSAKVGEAVAGGLGTHFLGPLLEKLPGGNIEVPGVGSTGSLVAGIGSGVAGHAVGERVPTMRGRGGVEARPAAAPAAQRRAPVLEPAAAGGAEAGTYDYRIFKPDGSVDVKATAAKIFTDLGSPVHALLREGVQNGALSRSFSIVKAAQKKDEARRLEEASRPERTPRPAVPDDPVYGATTQDRRYGAIVKAGVEAASSGNQAVLIEQNLKKNNTTWADFGDNQAAMQPEVPSWLKRPEEGGTGGKAHTPDDVAGLVSDIRAAVQAVREGRAGTDTRSQMGAAARRVRGAEAPPGAMGMLGRDARQLRTGEQNPVQPEDTNFPAAGEMSTYRVGNIDVRVNNLGPDAGGRNAIDLSFEREGAQSSTGRNPEGASLGGLAPVRDLVNRLRAEHPNDIITAYPTDERRARIYKGLGFEPAAADARSHPVLRDVEGGLLVLKGDVSMAPQAPRERPRTSWRVTPTEGEAYTAETLAGARSGSVEEAQATFASEAQRARDLGDQAKSARRAGEAQQAGEGLRALREQTRGGGNMPGMAIVPQRPGSRPNRPAPELPDPNETSYVTHGGTELWLHLAPETDRRGRRVIEVGVDRVEAAGQYEGRATGSDLRALREVAEDINALRAAHPKDLIIAAPTDNRRYEMYQGVGFRDPTPAELRHPAFHGEEPYQMLVLGEGLDTRPQALRGQAVRPAPTSEQTSVQAARFPSEFQNLSVDQLRGLRAKEVSADGVSISPVGRSYGEELYRRTNGAEGIAPQAARQRGTGQGMGIISQRQAREAEVPEVRLTKDLPAIKPKVLADFQLQPPPEGTPPGRLHQPEPKAKAVVIVRNQPGLDAVGPVSRNGQRVGNMYVGDLPDVDTWVSMTEDSAPSEQQIFKDARYYPEVPAQLQQLFQTSTPEEFSRIVRGYAMGNRRTSSERAAGDVLRVEERLAGVQRLEPNKQGVLEQSKGSMNADIIARALELDPSQEGVGPKLFDFEDLLMGKTEVRTWAGDDPRGGKPFVADTHTSRDAGYIDDEVARYVKKLTGKSLEEMGLQYDQVPVVGGSNGFNPSQVQYELISRWGNEMTAELNKRSWLGKSDWEPSEIQAIGWARVRRELGLEDSGADSVRRANSFQIAVPSLKRELDLRGVELPRSELAGINDRYLDAVVDTVHEHIPQARFTKTESAGLDGVRYDVFSSPETAHEVALALSHATEGPVYYYREAKSGKQNHVDVVVPEGRLSRADAGAIAEAVKNLSTEVTYSPDGHLRIFGTPGGDRGRAQLQAAIDAVPGDTAVQLRHGNGDLVKVGEDGSHADAVDTLARTRRDAAAALQLRDPLRARWTDAALAPGEHTRTPGGDVGAAEPGAAGAAPAAGAEPGAGGFAVPPGAAGIAGGPSGGRPPRRPKAQEPAPEVDTLAQMRAAARVNREDVARTERMARRDVAREKKQAEASAKRQAEREAAKPPNAPAARPAGLRTPTPEAMGETGRIRPPDTRFREEPTVEAEPEGAPSGLRGALQSAAAEARALVSAPIALKSTLSPPFLRQGLARVVTNPVKAVRELKQSMRLALNDTGATELNDAIKADDWVRDSKAYLKEQAAKPRTGPAGQGPRGAHDGYTWQDVEGQVLEWKDSGLERMTLAELKEVADRAGSSYSSKATKEQVLGQLKRDMTPEELAGFSNTRVGRAAEWWTRPSNRQAALQLNLNRTNWYKEVAQQMWDAGERDVKQYRDLRQTIEQATQRGSWAQPGKLPAFFSTRAMSGRVQFAWRGVDAIARGGLWDKAGPRREASRAFTATVLANAAMLGGAYAAASAAGLEPSIDWDGKLPTLKVGTHHWDPWAGLNTPARFAVGVVMDTIENPEGGLENVPQAFGASAYKRGAKFLRGGLSPVFGKAVDIGTGRDYTGRKYNLAQDVTSGNLLKDLTAPFIAESTLESAQQGGPVAAAITTPASFLSTSINAYDTPEDTANALAKKNYNGRSYDQLKTPEQLKVIDSMPEADKARVKEAKQDRYKEELKKSGFVEPEPEPKDKVETLDEKDARERRNAPVKAKNREIIAKDPDLEVQRWFFADKHGGALSNKDAVNTAIQLALPEREVKFAGHARDFGRTDEDKAFWAKYGNWLDDIENVRPESAKNQDNYAAFLFEGKKYKDLKDTEQSRVRSAIHAASIDDPRSEALQVFAGGVGPNANGEYVLSSPAVKAELEKLWKAYPKARRLPVLEHNGHKTTTLTKPGTS